MIIRRLLFALSPAGARAGQTFVQMSDPQFGMFTKNASFEHETVNLEFAIANASRLTIRQPSPSANHSRLVAGSRHASNTRSGGRP